MDAYGTDAAVRAELAPGESLRWSGRPRQGLMLQPSDALAIPVSLLWCGFVVFWEVSVIRGDAPLLFALWGVPFVCAGLYFVFGRFFTDARVRRNTIYAVTDRRLMIIRCGRRSTVSSTDLRQLGSVDLREHAGARATIEFGAQPVGRFGSRTMLPSGWPGAARYQRPSFQQIEDGRRVHALILEAQQALG